MVELFYRKFSAVTGSLNAEGDDDDQFRPNVNFIEWLSVRKVNDAIANLSTGVGFDGVHSNHLKFSSPLMIFVFCKFFYSCLIHNYITSSILAGVINPIIKNKAGNVRDSQNFREIMISSNFFKVFEYILLPFIKQLPLSSYQFGYRSGSSTILATTLLKEAIDDYISDGGKVYTCFLDMSKAFEYVDHELLQNKLVCRGMPSYVVNMLRTIYSRTSVSVHVHGIFSNSWKICQGVRQGGVTSAFLFNLYIDDILTILSCCKVGCYLGINRINCQAYADDIVLLSPSVSSLQFLINKISFLLDGHKLCINTDKTVAMVFNK